MTGDYNNSLYLNIETNVLALYHYKTKEKMVTQPTVFPNNEKFIDIDVPSGKLVFGYYNVFEVFQNRDEQSEHNADYFDSEQEKKNFLDLYQSKNIAMWYDGGFRICKEENANEGNFRFVDECNASYGETVGEIEHDKCTCLVDLDTLLANVEGTNHTFENNYYKEVPFTKDTMTKESKTNNSYKALQIIDVPKGKYRVSIVDYKDRTEVYEEGTPADMIGYSDNLDYTLYGGIELIEKY